jgi:hypothetical protein
MHATLHQMPACLMNAGAWNLSKAPFLKWSDGDLWNVTLELAAGGVYEYK